MNWQDLRDMGIDPDDGCDVPPLTDEDYAYMTFVNEHTPRWCPYLQTNAPMIGGYDGQRN